MKLTPKSDRHKKDLKLIRAIRDSSLTLDNFRWYFSKFQQTTQENSPVSRWISDLLAFPQEKQPLEETAATIRQDIAKFLHYLEEIKENK